MQFSDVYFAQNEYLVGHLNNVFSSGTVAANFLHSIIGVTGQASIEQINKIGSCDH